MGQDSSEAEEMDPSFLRLEGPPGVARPVVTMSIGILETPQDICHPESLSGPVKEIARVLGTDQPAG